MSRRNQPYIPLFVQDFLTDEKLIECSAESTGVYIRLICIMHKSKHYGSILLKQKHKQSTKQILNFACQLVLFMPYEKQTIERALSELLDEDVLQIEGDFLCQKRMIKDNELSESRALAGSKGGKSAQKKRTFASTFAKAKHQASALAKIQANYEIENENENESKDKGVIFPFDDSDFERMWSNWKDYKRTEFKFKYKSPQSEQAALKKLASMSNNDKQVALAIIEESMSNGWKGFFATKPKNDKQTIIDEILRS